MTAAVKRAIAASLDVRRAEELGDVELVSWAVTWEKVCREAVPLGERFDYMVGVSRAVGENPSILN